MYSFEPLTLGFFLFTRLRFVRVLETKSYAFDLSLSALMNSSSVIFFYLFIKYKIGYYCHWRNYSWVVPFNINQFLYKRQMSIPSFNIIFVWYKTESFIFLVSLFLLSIMYVSMSLIMSALRIIKKIKIIEFSLISI